MPEPTSLPPAFREAAPVGRGDYQVRAGECLQSIASEHGHFWKTVWDHGDNADVRSARKDPMVIQRGDRLTIPPIDPGGVSGATEKRHRFRRKGVPAVLKFQMLRDGEPRKDEPWVLELDGHRQEGETDGDGRFRFRYRRGLGGGVLRVGEGVHETVQTIDLGHLDPFDTVLGTQQRLTNLGFYEGPENGEWSEQVKQAIDSFLGQTETEVSKATLEKIRDAHGS